MIGNPKAVVAAKSENVLMLNVGRRYEVWFRVEKADDFVKAAGPFNAVNYGRALHIAKRLSDLTFNQELKVNFSAMPYKDFINYRRTYLWSQRLNAAEAAVRP